MATELATEAAGKHADLELKSVNELLKGMNEEDKTVPWAVEKAIPQIEPLVHAIVEKMRAGGRLFYIGAGTSGRLGIVDASECPPTFGVDFNRVIGLIAGGDGAIRKAVEFAEDNTEQAWKDLQAWDVCNKDVVIGIAASGRTPYVLGGLLKCNEHGIITGSIACNENAEISKAAKYPVEVVTGPEFVRGSTRMKAGTAQKLVLNMISTSVMIQLGHVKGNKMVDMMLSNHKLEARGAKMVSEELNIPLQEANELLAKHGSVRKAIEAYKSNL